MRKISKWKKFRKVFKRKLLKPLTIAVCVSFVLYQTISNIVLQYRLNNTQTPHFLITRISDDFDETEFMHMLLTIQEIRGLPEEGKELRNFVNGGYKLGCPKLLKQRLYQMNWSPEAFLSRVQKLFAINETYERLVRMDETIAFLTDELKESRLPTEMWNQVELLTTERDNLIGTEISKEEYNFMQQYGGIVIRLQEQN